MPFNSKKGKQVFINNNPSDSINFIEGDNIEIDINNNDVLISTTLTQFTAEDAQDAVGSILTDSSTVNFTYDDALNTITASVIQSDINHSNLQNIGTNSHTQIDNHIADNNIHLTIENIQDNLANSFIIGEGGITTTYNDSLNTLTFGIDESEFDINSFDGILEPNKGGINILTTPSNGQLLIGNGVDYSLNTLSAGANITITNNPGSITIAANLSPAAPGTWSWAADDGSNPSPTPIVHSSATNSVAIGEGVSIGENNTNSYVFGYTNSILNNSGNRNSILGGSNNQISGTNVNSVILGGSNNEINTLSDTSSFVIIGGSNNILNGTGIGCIIGGYDNITSGNNSLINCIYSDISGSNNTLLNNDTTTTDSNSNNNLIMGKDINVISSTFNWINGENHTIENTHNSIITGKNHDLSLGVDSCVVAGVLSKPSHSYSFILGGNDISDTTFNSQTELCVFKGTTTNNSPTILTLGGLSTSNNTSEINLANNNSGLCFSGKIMGINSSGSQIGSYSIEGTVKNTSGTASLIYSNVTVLQEDDAAWDVTLSVTSNKLRITVTGVTATTIYWSGIVELTYLGINP